MPQSYNITAKKKHFFKRYLNLFLKILEGNEPTNIVFSSQNYRDQSNRKTNETINYDKKSRYFSIHKHTLKHRDEAFVNRNVLVI